jgi:hypothetical protein
LECIGEAWEGLVNDLSPLNGYRSLRHQTGYGQGHCQAVVAMRLNYASNHWLPTPDNEAI